jgi:hypothetical protein
MTLFDAYVMVDWSANARPKTRRDSVWYSVLTRERGGPVPTCGNPATRQKAIEEITGILGGFSERKVSTLIGFDFPYGYPSGLAKALNLPGKPWRAVWDAITARVEDHADNSNNRFEVAAEFNRKVSGGPFPFWGCPGKCQSTTLKSCKVHPFSTGTLPEYRVTDHRAKAKGAQSVWKLYYPGAVGGQALLGIPYLAKLRAAPEFDVVSRVWPFETGLQPLPCRGQRDWTILHAEIFPSLFRSIPGPGEIKDEAQVRDLAEYFAELDEKGELGSLFSRPAGITDEECCVVECEEGWILGIR